MLGRYLHSIAVVVESVLNSVHGSCGRCVSLGELSGLFMHSLYHFGNSLLCCFRLRELNSSGRTEYLGRLVVEELNVLLSKTESLFVVCYDFFKVRENRCRLAVVKSFGSLRNRAVRLFERSTALRTEQSVIRHFASAFIAFHNIPPVDRLR